ncbi:MAG: hypothetical protein JRG80_16335, partial [Deltaproteobacteria bacterium]|nr:hypothetical protein [Deltaproteobacteria bacterium]
MSTPRWTGSLQLDQAPPLAVPTTFFVTAPIAAFAAGGLLLAYGASALTSNWAPQTLALTHLGTLGFLAMTMFGALYQLAPVVAGARVPAVGLSRAVHALLVLGLAGLVAGLITATTAVTMVALLSLALAVMLFMVPMARALHRAPTRNATVSGMRLAVSSLLLAMFLGLWMAHGHIGMPFPGSRSLWVQVHLGIGFLGWVGGLISAVSWQVLPMFYGATPHSEASCRVTLAGIALGVALPTLVLALDFAGVLPASWPEPSRLAALCALPAVIAVWCLQPFWALRGIAIARHRESPSATATRREPALLARRARIRGAIRPALGPRTPAVRPASEPGRRLARHLGLGRADRARDAESDRPVPGVVPPFLARPRTGSGALA